MSKYTTEVRFICESFTPDYGNMGIKDIIKAAIPRVFDEDIVEGFNAAGHGDILNKILSHYYTREIAFETFGLWKLHLNNLMRENLSVWVKLYNAADTHFQVFDDVNITRTHYGDSEESGETRTTSDSTRVDRSKNAFSATPQGTLTEVESGKYLTNFTQNDGQEQADGHTSGTNTNKKSENYSERVFGKQGGASYASMLTEYRNAVFSVDCIIIASLSDMFFNLW